MPRPARLVVGLVGGIGAGKSEVARELAARGAWVFDADGVAREILADPRRAAAVERDLGLRIRAGSRIDRRAIAARVFEDPEALARLEARIHPEVRRRAEEVAAAFRRDRTARILVLDVPLLLEAGFGDLCDAIVCVEAPRAVRVRRVRARRGWTAAELLRRERRQWPIARKRARADLRIRNAGGRAELKKEVDRLIARLETGVPARMRSCDPPDGGEGDGNGQRKVEGRSEAQAAEAGGERRGGAQGGPAGGGRRPGRGGAGPRVAPGPGRGRRGGR